MPRWIMKNIFLNNNHKELVETINNNNKKMKNISNERLIDCEP